MIVKCTRNRVSDLGHGVLQKHVSEHVHQDILDISIGDEYHVFGVAFREGVPWYLIVEEAGDDYPTLHCSVFFELVDASIENGWSLTIGRSNLGDVALLPAAWANDGQFLEKLIDGDSTAIAYFNQLKLI